MVGFAAAVGWDLTNASYDSVSFNPSEISTQLGGCFFKDDGTKMYLADNTLDDVFQYDLSTAWDLSTASYDSKSIDLSGQIANAQVCFIGNSGAKLYSAQGNTETIYQYGMTTPWDLSTGSYDSKFKNVTSETGAGINDVFMKDDGLRMFVLYLGVIWQYTLGTAWDVSTASYDSVTKDFSGQDNNTGGLFIKPDGTKLYMGGGQNDKIFQFTMSTPWDLSTASSDGIDADISGEDSFPIGLHFREDNGTKMYVSGGTNDEVFQYSL